MTKQDICFKTEIEVIPIQKEHYADIEKIVLLTEPIMQEELERKLGKKITSYVYPKSRWDEVKNTFAGENSFVVLAKGKTVGFVHFKANDKKIGTITHKILLPEWDCKEMYAKIYSSIFEKMRRQGLKYAETKLCLDEEHNPEADFCADAGIHEGLPMITYYVELEDFLEGKANSDIVFVPFKEEYMRDLKTMLTCAWTPIRKEQNKLLGDEIYNVLFENWEEAKVEAVMQTFCEGFEGYIALLDGEAVGFISYSALENKVGEIGNNCVSPEHTGKRIGTTMYRYAINQMIRKGMQVAKVATGLDDGHAPARRTYEKAGFTPEVSTSFITCYVKL